VFLGSAGARAELPEAAGEVAAPPGNSPSLRAAPLARLRSSRCCRTSRAHAHRDATRLGHQLRRHPQDPLTARDQSRVSGSESLLRHHGLRPNSALQSRYTRNRHRPFGPQRTPHERLGVSHSCPRGDEFLGPRSTVVHTLVVAWRTAPWVRVTGVRRASSGYRVRWPGPSPRADRRAMRRLHLSG
jgi:hypothetical protein